MNNLSATDLILFDVMMIGIFIIAFHSQIAVLAILCWQNVLSPMFKKIDYWLDKLEK